MTMLFWSSSIPDPGVSPLQKFNVWTHNIKALWIQLKLTQEGQSLKGNEKAIARGLSNWRLFVMTKFNPSGQFKTLV